MRKITTFLVLSLLAISMLSCKDFNKKCHALIDGPIEGVGKDIVMRFQCNEELVMKDFKAIPNTLCGKAKEMKPGEIRGITCQMIASSVINIVLKIGTTRWQCQKPLTADALMFITDTLCTVIPFDNIKEVNQSLICE